MKKVADWPVAKIVKTLGWAFIILWIPLVMFLSSEGKLSEYSAEDTTRSMWIWLLIPIGLISIPLTYTFNFSYYRKKKSSVKISVWARVFFSLFMTSIILTLSWYLYILLSVVLYFRFNI